MSTFLVCARVSGEWMLHGAAQDPFKVIHSFTGGANDGAVPTGTPVLDSSTLYCMTTQGGSNGIGTIFRIDTDGSGFQLMHSFANTGGTRRDPSEAKPQIRGGSRAQ